MRLDQLLAAAGLGSRKEVRQLVKKGLIRVNAQTEKDPGRAVDPDRDEITATGQRVLYQRTVWYMLNKPAGYLTAVKDSRQKTVMDLLPGTCVKRRGLFPVGRLDADTEGLLLITDDGDAAHRLLSPAHHVPKTYLAVIEGQLTPKMERQLKEGCLIGDDKPTLPADVEVLEENKRVSLIGITVTEGRYHQIKRMFRSVGTNVLYLKRISMGDVDLDLALKPGESRPLTGDEIGRLTGKRV